jgi:site-specific DNA-methyltransferase (cytosine-N4-specific)
MSVRLLQGEAFETLARLENGEFDCCVTSPPYFGLRDYGMAQQIGLEATPEIYIQRLVLVFREIRRVMKPTGTLWLNLGDTANNRRRIRSTSHQPSLNKFSEDTWAEATKKGLTRLSLTHGGLKEKDAFGIPWAVAFALRTDGWFLRQEIIWAKNFGKPEPSPDRLPNRHEQLFLFSACKNYHFDRNALPAYASGSVWFIPPHGRQDHGAAFSRRLVEPCLLAGCPLGGSVIDPFAGSGTTGVTAASLGRSATLIELNPDYVEIATRRLAQDATLLEGAA